MTEYVPKVSGRCKNVDKLPTSQLSLDLCSKKHKFNKLSDLAHESIVPLKQVIINEILNYISAQGTYGATCDELEQALNLSHQTASARCSEIKLLKLATPAPFTRPTRSGRAATVLVIGEVNQ